MKNGILMKIICSFMFVFLIIALVLWFAGVRHVSFNQGYYNFMQAVAIRANDWNIKIPSIPTIPLSSSWEGLWIVINILVSFFNMFVNAINGVIMIINFFISIFTTIVSIITLIKDAPSIISGTNPVFNPFA